MSTDQTPPPPGLKVIYEVNCLRPRNHKDGCVHHELGKITLAISEFGHAYGHEAPLVPPHIRRRPIDACGACRLAGHAECRCSWLVDNAIVAHTIIDWLITHAGLVVDDDAESVD